MVPAQLFNFSIKLLSTSQLLYLYIQVTINTQPLIIAIYMHEWGWVEGYWLLLLWNDTEELIFLCYMWP